MRPRNHTRSDELSERARSQIHYRGFTPNKTKVWTAEEDAICRRHAHDFDALMRSLPDRSIHALRKRRHNLGLVPKVKICTAAELSRVRRLYPKASKSELLAALPTRTMKQIRHIANYNGIRRVRQRYAPSGFEIIDSIRERCRLLNYSMRDLDEIAKTGCYFQRANWFNRRTPHYAHVGRAIEALAGRLVVEWEDA